MDITSERVALGATDVQVSPIGTGAWSWGDRFIWGYGKGYNERDVSAAYRAAIEGGLNWFDTAELYGFGQSERLLGQCLATAPRAMIATKFFPLPWRLRAKDVVRALRGSLKRLGLAQVDLYQIHWSSPLVPVERQVAGLADAVEAGLARAVGVSNYNTAQMRRAHAALARRGIPLASNQVEYSLVHRQPEWDGLLAACRELKVTLIAYSPLGMGSLTGKYSADNPLPGMRGRSYDAQRMRQIEPLLGRLRELGKAHGDKTSAQVALNWIVQKGAVAIPGAKNECQARENAGALGWQLTPDEVAALDRASELL